MKEPNQKQQELILKICSNLSHRFTFSYYDKDDIFQEAWIIAYEAFQSWDEERDLETFLVASISNRLRNLIRLKGSYSKNANIKQSKERLEQTANIYKLKEEETPYYEVSLDDLSNKELIDRIEDNLGNLRNDYLKLKAGKYITPVRKEAVYNSIIQTKCQTNQQTDPNPEKPEDLL